MTAPVVRVAPTCWAIVREGGLLVPRLLTRNDLTPPAALATFRQRAEVDGYLAECARLASAPSPTTGDLFASVEEQRESRDKHTDLALLHADPGWKDRAWAWIVGRKAGDDFTSDDLTTFVGMPTSHANAVGAVFNCAARADLIRKTDRYVMGKRATCRGAVLAVWVRTATPGR